MISQVPNDPPKPYTQFEIPSASQDGCEIVTDPDKLTGAAAKPACVDSYVQAVLEDPNTTGQETAAVVCGNQIYAFWGEAGSVVVPDKENTAACSDGHSHPIPYGSPSNDDYFSKADNSSFLQSKKTETFLVSTQNRAKYTLSKTPDSLLNEQQIRDLITKEIKLEDFRSDGNNIYTYVSPSSPTKLQQALNGVSINNRPVAKLIVRRREREKVER